MDRSIQSQKYKEIDLLFIDENILKISSCFKLSNDGKILFHSGFWDNSLRITSNNGTNIFMANEHGNIITCLDIGDDGKTMVTGSADTSVR